MTFAPNARAIWATRRPIAPSPMIPHVLPLISEKIDETSVFISFDFNAENELKRIVETQDYQNRFTTIILNAYIEIQSYEEMLSYQERLIDAIAEEFELDASIIDVALVSQFPYQ